MIGGKVLACGTGSSGIFKVFALFGDNLAVKGTQRPADIKNETGKTE